MKNETQVRGRHEWGRGDKAVRVGQAEGRKDEIGNSRGRKELGPTAQGGGTRAKAGSTEGPEESQRLG